jgi:Rrf2 family protein
MIFSKTFGYALRGILYIAAMRDEKRYVQVEEIASKLAAPRHFMGKIMKRLAKEKLLTSTKGPSGGFIINENTLEKPLMELIVITEGVEMFDSCVLRAKECNGTNPCPMHSQMEGLKNNLRSILSETSIGDLLEYNKPEFIKSLSTAIDVEIPKLPEVQKVY